MNPRLSHTAFETAVAQDSTISVKVVLDQPLRWRSDCDDKHPKARCQYTALLIAAADMDMAHFENLAAFRIFTTSVVAIQNVLPWRRATAAGALVFGKQKPQFELEWLPRHTAGTGQHWPSSCQKDHSAVTIMPGMYSTFAKVAYVSFDSAEQDREPKNTFVLLDETFVNPVAEL